MRLTHSFTVPVGVEQAWEVLLDIERVAPCMPGAALETVDGDDFTGSVKVRLGPIGLTYRGKASFVEKDVAARRVVIDAQGKDARGNGTAKAIITATLTSQGSGTAVKVVTDLNITGKPAQFGRGVMVDVGNKLIGQFADCLAGKLSGPDEGSPGAVEAGEAGGAGSADVGGAGTAEVGGAGTAEAGAGTAEVGAGGVGAAEAGGAGGVGPADAATVERLAAADLEGAEQLGTADSDTVELASGDSDTVERGTAAVEPGAAGEAAPQAQRAGGAGPASAGPRLVPQPPHRPAVADVEPINLLGSAGPAVAKRLAPVAALALLIVLVLLRRRRR